jgi:hypothetical protein
MDILRNMGRLNSLGIQYQYAGGSKRWWPTEFWSGYDKGEFAK